jgi:predicted ATPase
MPMSSHPERSTQHSALPRKIVITGGPGSGKTVITGLIADSDPRFVHVPEAATQIYTQLQTRWDKLDLPGRYDAQRRMYRLQHKQETHLAHQHPEKILLLDRGTIDGAAYWPDGPEAFWQDVGTTHAAELARYDAVIILETAAALGLYDGDASNAVRFEDSTAAIAAGEMLHTLWGGHPHVLHVRASEKMDEKIRQVRETLDKLLRVL